MNAPVSNVGVGKSTLSFGQKTSSLSATGSSALLPFTSVSKYSLIGEFNRSSLEWAEGPGDNGYGGTLDLKQLYTDFGSDGILKNQAMPIKTSDPTLVTHASGNARIEKFDGNNPKDIPWVEKTQKAAGNNIGYYVGADVKFYAKKTSGNVTLGKYYQCKNATEDTEVTSTVSPEVDAYIKKNYAETIYALRLTGQNQPDLNDCVAIPDGNVGGVTGTLIAPSRCIWIAPTLPGTLKFVALNFESDKNANFVLYQITRRVAKDFTTGFSDMSKAEKLSTNGSGGLKKGKLYYYQYPITQDDVDAGHEYLLARGNTSCYFSYIDIGTNGSGTGTKKGLKNVDWVYSSSGALVPYLHADGSKNPLACPPSRVSFELLDQGTASDYAFRRILSGETSPVLYYPEATSSFLPSSTGNSQASSDAGKDNT